LLLSINPAAVVGDVVIYSKEAGRAKLLLMRGHEMGDEETGSGT
jgi:hypothetical protein